MHRTAAALLLATAALLTTSCTSNSPTPAPPAATPAATTTPTAATPTTASLEACTRAIYDDRDKGNQDAPECASLSFGDYFKAMQEASERHRKELDASISAAAEADGQ